VFGVDQTLKSSYLLFSITVIFISGCGQSDTPAESADSSQSAHPQSAQPHSGPPHSGPPQSSAATISIDALRTHIKELSSDRYGGRAPGSEGEILTLEYLQKSFRKAGLKPGNGNSYTQQVPLTSVEVTNKPVLRFSGSDNHDLQLSYPDQQVVWSRQQITSAAIKDSQMVFVGYGINAPERGWNDYEGVDVEGKTVVMLVNDPGYATQDEKLFNGNAMTYYGRWDYKFDEAARQGASAAIIIHDTKPAAYPWTTVSSSWTGPQFDMVRQDKGSNLALVEGWITYDSALTLFNKAGLDLATLYETARKPGFKPVDINLTASVSLNNEINTVNSNNVAALVPGSEYPEEIFIFMAHWDHIGTDPEIEGDGIYNGALDNATGTAGLLEIARVVGSLKPSRSILFLALTAEEQGLLGSAFYAANPLYPLRNTVGGLNMDGLNNFGPTHDITVIGLGMSELDDYLEHQARLENRVLKPDAEAEKGYFYRSDHFELAKLGVPMLYPNSGYDHTEKGTAYGLQMSEEFTANHYHRPSDQYDDSWDLSGAVQDLEIYLQTGLEVANSRSWPQWHDGTEFKAIRDRQRQAAE